MGPLKSRPADPRETERRVREALGKHRRGERLTQAEETVVYWLRHGGACHACGGMVGVAVAGGTGGRPDGGLARGTVGGGEHR